MLLSTAVHVRHRSAWSVLVPRSVVDRLRGTPVLRRLQWGLGLIWLLDAALQYQPFMFTRSFVTGVVEPTTAGNPSVVARSVTWSAHLMLHHIAVDNAVFATIQLVIAVGFFSPRTVRWAMAASIPWAVLVWWFGESLGGIFTGSSPLAGSPGAVVLYALLAVLLWPRPQAPDAVSPAEMAPAGLARAGLARAGLTPATSGPLGAVVARALWVVLWGSFAWYLVLPANRAPRAVSQLLAGIASGQPQWVASIDQRASTLVGDHGTGLSIALAALCALVAVGVLARPLRRAVVVVAVLVALVFWVAEGFGGVFTGQGTDPNSGPLLVLLAASYWPYRSGSLPIRAGWPAGPPAGRSPAR